MYFLKIKKFQMKVKGHNFVLYCTNLMVDWNAQDFLCFAELQ